MLLTDTDRVIVWHWSWKRLSRVLQRKRIFWLQKLSKRMKILSWHKEFSCYQSESWNMWLAYKRLCWIKVKNVYIYITEDSHECKGAKGINGGANIKHEEYESVLFNKICMRHEMNRIQSKDHNIKLIRFRYFVAMTKTYTSGWVS